ncbi:MAG: C25 family cysteine peptidase [Planctomycetota bacterium]
MIHNSSRSGRVSASRLMTLGCIEVLVFLLCAKWVSADLTDTRINWSLFNILPVTHLGSQISDYESSADPTNGGAAVQPKCIDLASASPYPANPGVAPTSQIGYYDGGTDYDPNDPATMTDDVVMFRMRIDDNPSKSTGFEQYHWNVVLDVDGDGFKEFWIDVNGPFAANGDDRLHILYNNDNTQLMPDRAKNPQIIREEYVARNDEDAPNLSHTRVVACNDGSGDYWVDIQVPITAFTDLNGNQVVFPNSPLIPYYSTGASNQDPLQKDWFKVLQSGAAYDPANPIAADDPVVPDGSPLIYFTDDMIMEKVEYYWVGDNLYVSVVHADANTSPNVNETITVSVVNPATGDTETVTLRATSPDGSIFSNQGGASKPVSSNPTQGWIPNVFTSSTTVDETWTVAYNSATGTYTVTGSVSGVQANPITPGVEYTSDNGEIRFTTLFQGRNPASYTVTFDTYAADPLTCSTASGSNDNGDLQVNAGDTIYTTYTYDGEDYMDSALILGPGQPLIQFTWGDGTPTDHYQLNPDPNISDELYVTVTHAAANTNPNTIQTITISLASATDSESTITLTETGPNTGIFRNTSGLTSKVSDGTVVPNDGLWEDVDGAMVTATYNYGGTPYTSQAALFYTAGGGRVEFTNAAGTEDVEGYFQDDPVWLKVTDPNRTGAGSLSVTVVSATGDSEVVTVYETGPSTGVYMNMRYDLVTTASSAVVTSASSTFITSGLQPGDPFVIGTGPDAGTYIVQSVDSQTQVTLTTALTSSRTGIRFSDNPLFTQTYQGSYTPNDGILRAQDEDLLTVSYVDNNDGDSDPNNNTKTDTAHYYDNPTAIMLASFRATSDGGSVIVEWETAAECGTVGFYLLRKNETTKGYEQVNGEMLPALVSSPQGAVYRLADDGASADGRLTYKLVEVESNGKKRTYGPFHVQVDGKGPSSPTAEKSDQPRFERTARKSSFTERDRSRGRKDSERKPKPPKSLGNDAAVKIAVTETGLHYLSADEIAAAFGCTPEEAIAAIGRKALRLSHQGATIPFTPAEENRGIYFFGEKIDSQYTNENVYWLHVRNASHMPVVRGNGPGPAAPGASFKDTVHLEKDVFPATGFFTDPEADFWMWDYIFGGFANMDTKTYTMPVRGVAAVSGKAKLTVRLQGGSDAPVNPDHHVIVSLNNTPIGEARWDGAQPCVVNLEFAQNLLREGDNKITVKGLLDTGAPYSLFYVDSFDLAYQRLYQADADALLCRSGTNHVLSISGFSSPEIVVLEIKKPAQAKRIDALTIDQVGGNYRVSFRSNGKDVTYLVATRAAARRPASVLPDDPSALKERKNRADLVIIAPEVLKDAAQTLAAYRQGQGLSVMVVDLQDIYDEFNDGIVSPKAIKSFLAWAHGRWAVGPSYVLLAGEGTFDYKNIQGYGDNLAPPLLVGTPFGIFVSDIALADVRSNDGVPEMAIGRLPAATAAELSSMIAKITGYESASGAWRDRVMMLADYDDPDAGAFRADSDVLARLVRAPYTVNKIYLDDQPSATAARSAVKNGILSGCYLVNYVGHSFIDKMAKVGLLSINDVKYLTNGDRLPIVTTLTCLTGRHGLPGYDSLGEALVLKNGGGAVAFWGPSSLNFNSESRILGNGFFKAVFQDGQAVLGDAVVAAMKDFAASRPMPETIKTYALLGDPCLRIKGAAGGSASKVAKSDAPPEEPKAKSRSSDPTSDSTATENAGNNETQNTPAGDQTTASQGGTTSGGGSILSAPGQTIASGLVMVENTGSAMTLEVCPPSPVRSDKGLAIEGYGLTDSPGDPLLPMRGFAIPVPRGMTASATVLETETETLGDIDVPPVPRRTVQDLSNGKSHLAEGGEWAMVSAAAPQSSTYSRDAAWPAEIVRAEAAGRMGAIDLAVLTVTPVTYNPVARRATFHKIIRLRLDLRPDAAGAPADLDATGWQPPGPKAAKLRTSRAGIHRLNLTPLQSAALGARRLDQLAVIHRGVRVPVCVLSDGIDFLASSNPEPWARDAVYWIVASGQPSPRMAEVDAAPQKDAPPAVVAPQTFVLDEVRQVVFVADDMPLADRLILAEVAPGSRQEFKLIVCGPDRSAGADVRILAVGAADPSKVSISLNGNDVGDGLTAHVPPGKVVDGENTISIANNGADALLVKRIELSALPDLRAAKPGMRISVAQSGALTLAGLADEEAAIYDVTSDAPVRITGAKSVQEGDAWTMQFAASARHVYEIVDTGSVLSGSIEIDRPSDLCAGRHGADYVVIAPKAFETEAKRLAIHRASQGRRVEVVSIEDIFDEFAFGEADPAALRRFLAHAYRNWAPPVRQAVLFGDGSIGPGGPDLIPTHVELAGRIAAPSDSWFGCVDGADRLPDIQIGRLPVRTAAEAQDVVYKLIRYDSASAKAPWTHNMFHVGGRLAVKSRTVASHPVTSASEMEEALRSGGLLLSLLGPGWIDRTGDGLLRTGSASLGKSRSDGGALLISAETPHGYYASPTVRSLAEDMVCGRGGAIGAIVAAGPMTGEDARLATEGIVEAALNPAAAALRGLGSLLDVGRLALAGQDEFDAALRTSLLLGDPATILKTPPAAEEKPLTGGKTGTDRTAGQSPLFPDDRQSKYALIWEVLAPQSGKPVKDSPADATAIAIVVKATMVGGQTPYAIVQLGSGPQKLVKVGDLIGGAQVVAIEAGSLLLDINGKRLKIQIRPR